MSWNDERVELLSKLWLEGRSASQIAAQLGHGITRNAVIGKVHRLGLSGRAKVETPAQPVVRARSKAAPAVAATAKASVERIAPAPVAAVKQPAPTIVAEAPARADNVVSIPFSDRVTIMELRETMCRWPLGDPSSADFRYCGCRAALGPYCQEHARMAFQPTQERRRVDRVARIA